MTLDADKRSAPSLGSDQRRILVVNAKGGCGKTTLTTNIAARYATLGATTVLVDHDPQGSASRWLDARNETRPAITGIAPWKDGATTRSFQMRRTVDADRVVIDTPAALSAIDLGRWLGEADRVLIPVMPSAIDMKAGARFIGDLLLNRDFRRRPLPIAVVANRVRRNTRGFTKLERFLISLDIPFIATFRDLQGYVHAVETGDGLSELRPDPTEDAALSTLLKWLEAPARPRQASA